jgi:hypothetical protein
VAERATRDNNRVVSKSRLLPQLVVFAAVVVAGAPGDLVAARGGSGEIVLGAKHFVPFGIGWGTARPHVIFNGGDPSGRVWNIRWSNWGGAVAVGRGLNWIFRPQGGYYAEPTVIELRAYGVGQCSISGPAAYLHLVAREPSRPGGSLGPWFSWGGRGNHTLCRW